MEMEDLVVVGIQITIVHNSPTVHNTPITHLFLTTIVQAIPTTTAQVTPIVRIAHLTLAPPTTIDQAIRTIIIITGHCNRRLGLEVVRYFHPGKTTRILSLNFQTRRTLIKYQAPMMIHLLCLALKFVYC